jgi:uncharacterized RDD family membrane protein YckC
MEQRQYSAFSDTEQCLIKASRLKRLGNFVIDNIVYCLFITLVSVLLRLILPGVTKRCEAPDRSSVLLCGLLLLVLYILFMGASEACFNGKSIGKFITGTRTLNQDGTTISARTAILRGLYRAIPFSVFSALGNPCYPWQDRWTGTAVIDEAQVYKTSEALQDSTFSGDPGSSRQLP